MSLLKRKDGAGKFKAPKFDPYSQWGQKKNVFGLKKKDKHVILPGVTRWEENRLEKIKQYVTDTNGQECTIPQHMINDVYSMYVNEDIKRKEVNSGNEIKQKVISKVYNSLTKVVTQNSPLFSQIYARELAMYMQKIEDQIKEEQEKNGQGQGEGSPFDGSDDQDEGSDQGQGEGDDQGKGDGNSESEDGQGGGDENSSDSPDKGSKPTKDSGTGSHGDLVDKILNSKENEKALEKAMSKAEQVTKDLKEKLGEEALKDLSDNDPDFLDNINKIKSQLDNVAFNKDSIKEFLAKILNESQNYFSKNYHTVEESIFDSEDFDDLFGLEFLHPIFRNSELMSVGNATRVYTGKIDLYLDCSGSMGGVRNFEGKSLRMIDLVKGIAMVLYRMGMIDKLYFFDGGIYEIENINEFTILGFNKSGGTNFDRVVKQCVNNGRNSVVITDGEDRCSLYAKNIFWIGVGGTQFSGGYSTGSFNEYRASRQCVTYDSNSNKFNYVTP